MKLWTFIVILFSLTSCDPKQLGQFIEGAGLTDAEIASGLKEALDLGVDKSVKTLSAQNG